MSNLQLNREQLASFLSDPRTIRAFENLFLQVSTQQPSDIDAAQLTADAASAQAALALTLVAELASQIALAMVPQEQPRVEDHFEVSREKLYDGVVEQGLVGIFNPPIAYDTENHNQKALVVSAVSMDDGTGAAAATLTNAPAAGNPTKWIPIIDNGITRYIPTW